MAPNIEGKRMAVTEEISSERPLDPPVAPRKYQVVYLNVIVFVYYHLSGLYGLYLCLTAAKWATILYNSVLYLVAGWGVTAGVHRLWSHRAYKAKLPLQILLMLFQSMTAQDTVIHWARDHRQHHKYSDTDGDPHNNNRGFFYAHIGWLLVKKHPETIEKGKTLDMSDLYENPVLQFQKKYYVYLVIMLAFILPVTVPMYFWQETFNNAFHVSILRLIIGYNVTFLVNSAAHRYGNKPYDRNMSPAQSVSLSLASLGEGFHNYHHIFPFDYRTAELGNNYVNITTKFIDFFAWIGWAYDLKQATDEMIAIRAEKTGDGTDLWGREKILDSKQDKAVRVAKEM